MASDPIAEDPFLETSLKVPNLLLDKPQESANKPLFMDLNSLIESERSSNNDKSGIENKLTAISSAKSTHKAINQKLGLACTHAIKLRQTKDLTNFITKIKCKTEKSKFLKKKMTQNELKIREVLMYIFLFLLQN